MAVESRIDPDIGGKNDTQRLDRAIASLAERQHGVVARRQLFDLGAGRRAVEHRLGAGRLHAVHRGVYAVGHRVLSAEGRLMAAVLAGGPGAVSSHRSAAGLWGIRPTARAAMDITVQGTCGVRPGIERHRGPLPRDEVTVVRGIPVTTVARTLLDLAAVLERRPLERAIEEAEVRRLTDPLGLPALVRRHAHRRGLATIKAILATGRIGSGVTRSELEDRFLAFLDSAGLERPEVNANLLVRGRWFEGDCVWRSRRVIVELDGHASHATSSAYERDRARDRVLHAGGWRVVRLTWRQLHHDAAAIAADLGDLLADGPGAG